ncbi:hypothetical protein ROHU_002769 [Labeo rohita]|uniref:Uncharacterized protein n=1 Tax=Labeo rohita TaxID=84645 RepID=A0A498NWU3_LABRO|nr:hypothetical protein ROHU_002769 [Labeo rohita]
MPQDYSFSHSHRRSITATALLNMPHDFPDAEAQPRFHCRNVNKRTCTIYSSPSKSANLTPKSTPATKAANRSSKATIVPHKIRLLANIGSQQQAFNEPGPRPSSHPTHSLPASAQPFTAALPAAAPLAAGPLASVSRG